MFSNFNTWEVIALVLLALFIFGPERLPRALSDGFRMIRKARGMANDFSADLGLDNIQDLHPKSFIRRHLLSAEEEEQLRRPLDDIYRDVRQVTEEDIRQLPPPGLGRRSMSVGVAPSPPPEVNHQLDLPEVNHQVLPPDVIHHDASLEVGRHRAQVDEGTPGPTGTPDAARSTVEGQVSPPSSPA